MSRVCNSSRIEAGQILSQKIVAVSAMDIPCTDFAHVCQEDETASLCVSGLCDDPETRYREEKPKYRQDDGVLGKPSGRGELISRQSNATPTAHKV